MSLTGRAPESSADESGAWVSGEPVLRAPTGSGPLDGLQFAVKDLIDVAGSVTGCGNPDRAAASANAEADAPCVAALRAAGAAVAGKTISDEFAFSLEGENAHHGTPRNPHGHGRLPGGSSSGSAVAVAAGLVDFALGTDTGGSVRVPASFCGVFGLRPTHGAVSLAGVMPFAPSFDSVGWFARSAALMERVGQVLMPAMAAPAPLRLLLAADVFACADAAPAALSRALALRLGATAEVDAFGGERQPWLESYAALQGAEIRACLGPWMAAHRPRLGPAIAARFDGLATITDAQVADWTSWRSAQVRRLHALLENGGALLMPTTPGVALRRDADATERGTFYASALAMNALAGHAGLPQLSLPLASFDVGDERLPIGLSIIGAPGSDASLLRFACELAASGKAPQSP